MSAARGIPGGGPNDLTAPTPQNTPATHNMSASQYSRPQVPQTIGEDDAEEGIETISSANAASALAGHPALAALVQNRLAGLVGRSSGYVESLPPALRNRVDGLQGLQVDHAKIEADFQKDVLELEKRYLDRYRPLYERRLAIISGQVEPNEEEVQKGLKAAEEDEEDDEDDEDEDAEPKAPRQPPTAEEIAAAPKGLPGFWLTALGNHLGISDLITERDEACLKHLEDIKVSYLDGKPGFRLTFVFGVGAKEFFGNDELVKTYYYQDEVGYGGDFVYERAEGTDIAWKEGKDLTVKLETKKQRNKNTNQTRVVKKVVPTESFFNFFKPPVPPSPDDELEDDEQDDLEEKLELDYQIGEDLKERIVPRAIDFFTGKALRFEQDANGEMSDEYDDFDDDEDDEDDDDDDGGAGLGIAGARRARKAPVPPSGVTPASNQDPQECKQQ